MLVFEFKKLMFQAQDKDSMFQSKMCVCCQNLLFVLFVFI